MKTHSRHFKTLKRLHYLFSSLSKNIILQRKPIDLSGTIFSWQEPCCHCYWLRHLKFSLTFLQLLIALSPVYHHLLFPWEEFIFNMKGSIFHVKAWSALDGTMINMKPSRGLAANMLVTPNVWTACLCSLFKLTCRSSTLPEQLSEYRALIQVIKVNTVVSVGPWSQRILLYGKNKRAEWKLCTRTHRGKTPWAPVRRRADCGVLTRSQPCRHPILDFQTPGLGERKCPLRTSLTLWYFVVVAWAGWCYIFETKAACGRE